MFALIKKHLVAPAFIAAGILFLSSLIPVTRPAALFVLKIPLVVAGAVCREIGGIIFYHHNMSENRALQKKVELLGYRVNAMAELALENNRLTQLLGLQKRMPFKVIAARVIARAPDSWSSVVVIDKGSRSGIQKGMVVLNYFGLIGRVVEVSLSTSKVMLLNDPNLGVSAMIQRSRQEGLVSGTLGNFLIMRYLPKDADVRVNDTAVTSGLTDVYPKGLVIGLVVDVGDEFSGLSRYAVVKPACNLTNVEEVLVIIP